MSQVSSRSREKELYWRSHLARQSSSGESIRGYCLRRDLSEASFHFWRREIGARDRAVADQRGSGAAGLIAVEVVGDVQPSPLLEITCPGGAVIRLREGATVDVLTRVMQACQQVRSSVVSDPAPVRSC